MAIAGSTRRGWLRPSWPQAFFITALIEAVAVIALESYVFAQWQLYTTPIAAQVPASLTLPTWLAIFIFGFIYQILLIVDAIRMNNSIQIVATLLVNAALLVYAALQKRPIKKTIDSLAGSRDAEGEPLAHEDMPIWSKISPVLLAIPFVIGVGLIVLLATAFKVTQVYSWATYKQINGDRIMKHRIIAFQTYVVLLKLDFFFITAFLTIYAVPVLEYRGPEFIFCVVLFFITIIVFSLASIWTRREWRLGMIFTIAIFAAYMAYFVYKLVIIYVPSRDHFMFEATFSQLVMYASLSIAFLTLTIINAVLCLTNTGKGLKAYLVKPKVRSESPDSYEPDMVSDKYAQNMRTYNAVPRRLSLD